MRKYNINVLLCENYKTCKAKGNKCQHNEPHVKKTTLIPKYIFQELSKKNYKITSLLALCETVSYTCDIANRPILCKIIFTLHDVKSMIINNNIPTPESLMKTDYTSILLNNDPNLVFREKYIMDHVKNSEK